MMTLISFDLNWSFVFNLVYYLLLVNFKNLTKKAKNSKTWIYGTSILRKNIIISLKFSYHLFMIDPLYIVTYESTENHCMQNTPKAQLRSRVSLVCCICILLNPISFFLNVQLLFWKSAIIWWVSNMNTVSTVQKS